ncbi:MAG TPA: hypothetical protein VFY87_13780 [Geminicoccaceae bacterium]|nr:hypothetical protein [Geminicoccaceae bacterium]
MPVDAAAAPDQSRADHARRNGALSRGPATPEGKARSARNSTRHGLCAKTLVLGADEDVAALAALRGALAARHLPRDAGEAHWVEELAFAAWRQRRLRALEAEALARAGAAAEDADAAPALPSLSTLIRYRARLDRDWRRAGEELEALRRDRAVPPSPAQLRVVADLIERGQAAAADTTPNCTNENHALGTDGTNGPAAPATADEPTPGIGTNEPTAAANRTNEFTRRTDEPRHPVPPLPGTRTDEPDDLPAPPPLNRHQRRRLAALARLGLRRAA